jgi:hypothetical protein
MRGNKRLTVDEFNVLLPHLAALKKRNVEAIRSILVDGRKQTEVASELEMTVQAVSAMVGKAWQQHVEHGARPAGWVCVQATLPAELADTVKDMERNARNKLKVDQ